MCVGMKNICEKFSCKQSKQKVIMLVFIYVNLYLAYSIAWCIYVTVIQHPEHLNIWRIYMRQSSPKVLSVSSHS